ncbi:tRNA (guanine(9)-N1)-methyltransferase [Neonectria ditissima]|uniref:tRNA (guanine(9)-N1)-methyltransferase n=1 Tax=Neonectria ditissima TaxID=78410 RepID=A0A0P7AZA2_9HYPO|nr:tRNA (guanine(9)-N1)-methyltransferase [Neonectria ditissima]
MASPQPNQVSPPAPMEGVTSTTPQQTSSEPQNEATASLPTTEEPGASISGNAPQPPLSKNALKRMRKDKEWADGLEDRRRQRKEKRQDRRARKRDQRAALVAQGLDPFALTPKKPASINVPISLIFDCDFEQYMLDKELVSLGSQITRSYSENKNAMYRTHLWICGWKGKLAGRFRDVLDDMQMKWKGAEFIEGGLLECAEKARTKMQTKGGTVIAPLQKSLDEKVPWVRNERDPFPMAEPEPAPREEYKDVVYLSSDSPYTLERLEPNTSYVIGGLVDKNREKGLCYKRAREMGIRTARLPIGQYMEMQSRSVLATNHVVEIMLKWLQYENWGDAFLDVIPKRKGGQLRKQDGASEGAEEEEYELEEEEGGTEEVADVEGAREEKKAPEAVAEGKDSTTKS